jgi:hypothetical protein
MLLGDSLDREKTRNGAKDAEDRASGRSLGLERLVKRIAAVQYRIVFVAIAR